MYPKNITLRKINTLEEAEFPQQEKYPDGTERKGLMYEDTVPKVGEPFLVMVLRYIPSFKTSPIVKILGRTSKQIIFKTLNSTYELNID